jgi:hypothetical protein
VATVDHIGTAEGVRDICRRLQITEVSDEECEDDLVYGFGMVVAATNKTDWDQSETLYGLAVKVNEEFAAVNIALETQCPIETCEFIRKIADKDLKALSEADPSLLATQTGSVIIEHGGVREYQTKGLNPDKPYYTSPDL